MFHWSVKAGVLNKTNKVRLLTLSSSSNVFVAGGSQGAVSITEVRVTMPFLWPCSLREDNDWSSEHSLKSEELSGAAEGKLVYSNTSFHQKGFDAKRTQNMDMEEKLDYFCAAVLFLHTEAAATVFRAVSVWRRIRQRRRNNSKSRSQNTKCTEAFEMENENW